MLRKEIIAGVNNILSLLGKYDIEKNVVELARPREKKPLNAANVFKLFGELKLAYESLGQVERTILEIIDLGALFSSEFWSTALVAESNESRNVYGSLRDAKQFLPKFLKLIEQEDVRVAEDISKHATESDGLSTLTLFVIEDEQQLSTAERIIISLQSIQGLYDAIAYLQNEHKENLTIVSCDSGSDKSFDFLGAAQVIEGVKEIILTFWNNIVYFREDKTGRHLDLIAESLPILERITDMHKAGKLEPERAEILKRQIIESVKKFGRAGATIPEVEKYTIYNPRQLMKPEPKLLMAPSSFEATKKTNRAKASKRSSESTEVKRQKSTRKSNENVNNLPIDDPEFAKYMLEKAEEYQKRKKNKDSEE
jgi:hypothetical protein